MKATWEKIETNQGKLKVEVESERFEEALNKAFKKVSKDITVPGFRKGKVPRKIFEARFGAEALYQDALDLLLPDVYLEAVKETSIEPVDRPEVDVEQIEKGQPLIFTAKVTVKPEVTLGQYTGLTIPAKDFSVRDEDIEVELKQMQERVAELIPVEEGPIEHGDQVKVDFEGSVDGKPFEGGRVEDYEVEVGTGRMIPGFEEQLVGMKKGEEKTFQLTFPEEYWNKDLQGKEVTFNVKIKEAKRKQLPEIDDEFAKDVSEWETLDALKEDIKKRLTEEKEHEKKHYLENMSVQLAAANANVEIPEVMVENEIERMIHEYEHQLQMQGLDLDMYFESSQTTMDDLRKRFAETARTRVLNNLVIEAIAKAENIEASEEEIQEEMQKMAEQHVMDVEELKKIMGEEELWEELAEVIQVRKTLNFLVQHNTMDIA